MAEEGRYMNNLRYHFWDTTYEQSMQAAYDVVDLIFLNDEYCLFRKAYWDVAAFCH